LVKLSQIAFTWVDIPQGTVTLQEYIEIQKGKSRSVALQCYGTFDLTAFQIGKYPITNTQFALFVESGGYHTPDYWTEEGWQHKEQERWIEPHFWQVAEGNSADYPVVGVSWYEALAFCRWFSTRIGDLITLPTEPQWHRAAQGDDGRDCPWGGYDDDLEDYCNASIVELWPGNRRTSPVYQYEDKGNSPFKVVDMLGNVEEWTLTQYDPNYVDEGSIAWRITCGSWNPYWYGHLNSRSGHRQTNRLGEVGFRVCRFATA
jgi:formylglycine-generating enzyme required for sulfatase activity